MTGACPKTGQAPQDGCEGRRGVSVGEVLAGARDEAGLTVAQVSEQTRIRQTIIREIEGDDFSACGGDFYARGHIRSIARAVGTDPEPLVAEYDSARRAPDAAGGEPGPGSGNAGPAGRRRGPLRWW